MPRHSLASPPSAATDIIRVVGEHNTGYWFTASR